jgi:hypothetical protein
MAWCLVKHRDNFTFYLYLYLVFDPKREDVTGGCRKLFNEDPYNSYSSSHIVRVIKSRRMRWAGNVTCMGR